jgi:hypothetical protein
MPKTVYAPENADRSGVSIDYYKTRRRIEVSGWYDSHVGIEGRSFRLGEFLTRLGISLAGCRQALKEEEHVQEA